MKILVATALAAGAILIAANTVDAACPNVSARRAQHRGQAERHPVVATTSSTTFAPTFTSSCASESTTPGARAVAFVDEMREALWQDMAAGSGTGIAVLASLLGCPASRTERLGSVLQADFRRIVPDEEVSGADLARGIAAAIAADPELARSCTVVAMP